jgi:hypothetical protein
MVINTTFNNISVISWWKPEYTEKTTDLSQVTDKLYHIMLCTSHWVGVEPTTSAVIDTDCIGNCKSNYHTITATTTPQNIVVNIELYFLNVYWKNTTKYICIQLLISTPLNVLLSIFQGDKLPAQAPASNGPVNSAEVDSLTDEVSKQVSEV